MADNGRPQLTHAWTPASARLTSSSRLDAAHMPSPWCAATLRVSTDGHCAWIGSGGWLRGDRVGWNAAWWLGHAASAGHCGSLGHWVHIKDGKIANYQAVVPSTWNAGPRDAQGQRAPGHVGEACAAHPRRELRLGGKAVDRAREVGVCGGVSTHRRADTWQEMVKVHVVGPAHDARARRRELENDESRVHRQHTMQLGERGVDVDDVPNPECHDRTGHCVIGNRQFAGQAFSFDGSGFIEVPDDPALNPTVGVTLVAWVDITGGSTYRDIVSKDGETFDRQYLLCAATDDRVRS